MADVLVCKEGELADGGVRLVKAGRYPAPNNMDPAEHAAWTAVANVLLNLDETITRE